MLRPELLAEHADLARFECVDAIADWVENYWRLRWDLPDGVVYRSSTLPHPSCTLSVERGVTRSEVGADPVVLTGVVRHRFEVPARGRSWVFAVKFRPGGLAAFAGLDAARLTDRVVPARGLLPASVVTACANLDETVADECCVTRLDAALTAARPPTSGGDTDYRQLLGVIDDMLADRTLLRVGQIEQRHDIAARRLQRMFARYVGVGPKWVLARYRMHDAVRELDGGYTGTIADLATRYGWYDQAHFARAFTDLVGAAPGDYRDRHARHPG
ncbi:AraC family transcriptional regulator [Skermania piniformis]